MVNRVFETIDALPLAGKFSTRQAVKNYVEVDKPQEKKQYIKSQALMLGMVAAHAYQAKLGIDSLNTHIDAIASSEGDPLTYAAVTVDAVYMSINALVTARQANLMYRLDTIRKKKSQKERVERPIHEIQATSTEMTHEQKDKNKARSAIMGRAFTLAVTTTLVGQGLFLGSYFHAKEQANEIKCKETVSDIYDEYTEYNPDITFSPKDQYFEKIC